MDWMVFVGQTISQCSRCYRYPLRGQLLRKYNEVLGLLVVAVTNNVHRANSWHEIHPEFLNILGQIKSLLMPTKGWQGAQQRKFYCTGHAHSTAE